MIAGLDRALGGIERLFALFAALILVFVMLTVSLDVVMRYAFNRPLGWTYDLISLYLMTALFYLVLSRAFAEGAHISVDILEGRFPTSVRRVCHGTVALVSASIFGVIAWLVAGRTWDDFVSGAATSGAILWPTWLSEILVPVGAGLLTLRLLLHAAAHFGSLATGRDLVPLPVPAGSAAAVAKGAFE